MVQAVNNVSYNQKTRFTKKGNAYQKSNAAKWIGVGVGAGYGLAKNSRLIFNSRQAIEQAGPMIKDMITNIFQSFSELDSTMQEYINSQQFKNFVDSIPKMGIAAIVTISVIGATLVGLLIGGIANKIVNKVRASKADKNAQQQIVEQQAPVVKNNENNNQAAALPKSGFAAFQNATK